MIILIDPFGFVPKNMVFKFFCRYACDFHGEGSFGYFSEKLPHRKQISRNSL